MKCTAKKGNGNRCGADAMSGARRCFMHSPKTTRAAREARRRGGKARMLALRPVEGIVVAGGEGAALARPQAAGALAPRQAAGQPVAWAPLRAEAHLRDGVRDITRAVLSRQLDSRSANAALAGLQLLMAEKRARKTWAHEQLKDRLAQLTEEVASMARQTQGTRLAAQAHQVENLVEYIARLARRAAP